eukprot:1158386-Pelagomonas_calceolata.AAC.9
MRAVWQGMVEGRPVVGAAYVDAASHQLGVSQLDDDEQLCALEAIIVQLGAKEAVVCKLCALEAMIVQLGAKEAVVCNACACVCLHFYVRCMHVVHTSESDWAYS